MKPRNILKTIAISLVIISISFGLTIYFIFKEYKSLVLAEDLVSNLQTDIFQRRLVADDYLIYKNNRAKDQWWVKQSDINEFLKKGNSALSEKESQEILIQIEDSVIKSQQVFDQIIVLVESKESISSENLSRLNTQLTAKAQETISLAEELYRQVSLKKYEALDYLVLLFSVLISIYLLLLIISFIIIWRSVNLMETVSQMKSDFVSLVSHQLKTPVAQIKGFVENMLDGLIGEFTPKQKEYLSYLSNVANKNGQLIDDLLNISRIERGMLKVNIEPLDINSLLDETLSPLRNVAKVKGVVLEERLLGKSVMISGDPVKTREAIRNIVDNAIKFTPASKKVSVSAEDSGNMVVVEVSDQGIGIDPDVQTELFEKNRLYSGKVKASGAGLGLFLSKQFIELSGGIISFKTKLGEGTTFNIKFPKNKNGTNK